MYTLKAKLAKLIKQAQRDPATNSNPEHGHTHTSYLWTMPAQARQASIIFHGLIAQPGHLCSAASVCMRMHILAWIVRTRIVCHLVEGIVECPKHIPHLTQPTKYPPSSTGRRVLSGYLLCRSSTSGVALRTRHLRYHAERGRLCYQANRGGPAVVTTTLPLPQPLPLLLHTRDCTTAGLINQGHTCCAVGAGTPLSLFKAVCAAVPVAEGAEAGALEAGLSVDDQRV